MKYLATIQVMPKTEILDPQGKAVMLGLTNLGVRQVSNVRVGKNITLEIDAKDELEAKKEVDLACQKLLANLIMESFTYQIVQL